MRFKKLDLNLLVALDHMLELRSVTAAADKMFMSQSAMSNALTRLRTYFDDPLLVQVGRKMELTPRADSLRPAIRDILVRTEAAIDIAPAFDPTTTDRTFNLLLSDYSLRILMPSILRLAKEQNAKVGFNLKAQTTTPYLQLEQGEIDILISPEDFVSHDHPYTQLFEDEYVVVAWKYGTYGETTLDNSTYESAGHIAMIPPQQAQTVDNRVLSEAGLARNIQVTTFSFSTIPHLVSGTNLLATVHRRLAESMMSQAELTIHPLPSKASRLRQMMQWHTYRDSDPGIIWLRNLVQGAGQSLPKHSRAR